MEALPFARRGRHRQEPVVFGESRRGIPLECWMAPGTDAVDVLVVAGLHGEEPETSVVVSRALRSLEGPPSRCAVVVAANPDGLIAGTRGNAAGVDLNRNFPAANWSPAPTTYRWTTEDPSEIELSPGTGPASEPETRALLALWERLRPRTVVAVHAPLACIDDPGASALGRWLAERTGLPLVPEIGYPTPGSWGSWALDRGEALITYELPALSVEELVRGHTPVLMDLLAGRADLPGETQRCIPGLAPWPGPAIEGKEPSR